MFLTDRRHPREMSSITATDPTTALVGLQAEARAQSLSTVILKQQANQEQSLADLLADSAKAAARAAPPAGQGGHIDVVA